MAMPDLVRAKAVAYKLNQSLGISHPKEIMLEDIAMSRGVLVIEGQLDGAEARLIRSGNKGLIRVKTGLSDSGKGRFALAHELGHWEMHKDRTQWQFCSEDDLQDYTNSDLEIEANTFASEFLMPTVLFRPRCEESLPDLNLIKKLANEFQTTLTATAVRFIEETSHACLAIFSTNGKVTWWRKSPKCNSIWIEKKWEIKEGGPAWNRLRDESTETSDMTQIEPELWFNDECQERVGDVYEQSIKLGRYPTLLTLLWIP